MNTRCLIHKLADKQHPQRQEPKEKAARTHTGAALEYNINKTEELDITLQLDKLKKQHKSM